MLRTKIYSIISVCLVTILIGAQVFASEVTGTLTTDGGNIENPNPTPTPTPPPPPANDDDDDTGHSSEVQGELGTTVATSSTSSELSGTVIGGRDVSNTLAANVNSGGGGSSNNGSSAEPSPSPDPASPGISDEEAARLALLAFGPRFGFTPGAPNAGDFSDLSSLSVGSGVPPDAADEYIPSLAVLPSLGTDGPLITEEDLSAIALSSASGLTIPQLLYIAFIGLLVLASMGYAISRSNSTSA